MAKFFNPDDFKIEKTNGSDLFQDFRIEVVSDIEGGFAAIASEFDNVYNQTDEKTIIFENALGTECTAGITYQEMIDIIGQLNSSDGIANNAKIRILRDLKTEIRFYYFEAELNNGKTGDAAENTLVFSCSDLDTLYLCEIKVCGTTNMADYVVAVFTEQTIGTSVIENNSVSNSKLSMMPARTFKGNIGETEGAPVDVTVEEMKTELGINCNGIGAQPVMTTCTEITGGVLEIADNTEYILSGISSLSIVGNTNSARGIITFADTATAPAYDESVSRFIAKMGDDITAAAGGETWEFDTMGGCIIWRKWDVST